MEQVKLDRYQVIGPLGTGADYEVKAAVDQQTGQQVVLKRPVPQAVSRQMHGPIEERSERTVETYQQLSGQVPQLSPLLGYTDRADHSAFYGDGVSQEYRVLIFGRAKGIPLVGDVRARILRVPIGLGQNLFALYPLSGEENDNFWPVQQQLLDMEERIYRSGRILLDMGPQNVFYRPSSGTITVIDSGDQVVMGEAPISRSRRHRDIHDFYLEMLKFYTSPQDPPDEAAGYRDPRGMRPIISLEEEVLELKRGLLGRNDSAAQALDGILDRLERRDYQEFSAFRNDLTEYLEEVRIRYRELPGLEKAKEAWLEALDLLRAEHWKKYKFDAESELSSLLNGV